MFRVSILPLAFFMLFGAPRVDAETADRIVLMVSVDGLANFYLDDPVAEIPTLRRLVAEGARAQGMIASMPTVTWPNHTTLVTGVHPGKHGVLGNSVLDRAKNEIVPLVVDPLFNKDEIVKVPTIYDLAQQAGLKTAALIWPATRGARTLDWTIPDVGTLALVKQFATPSLLEEFTAKGIPWGMQEELWNTERIAERDRMFAQMGKHLLGVHRPHLLLMHFVELDHAQHRFGPRSPQAYAALKNQDACVGELWQELQRAHRGRATLVVVSDHGFISYRRRIQPNVLLRQEGLLTALGTRITGGSVRAVAQGGACFVYVLREEGRAAQVEKLAEQFRQLEGVGAVITPGDFAAHGLPDPAKNPQMADLVLSAASGFNFVDSPAGDVVVTPLDEVTKGSHGSDAANPDMHATFVAWGAGIQAGARCGTVSNTSVAPTLAALLGLKVENMDGPVLQPLLKGK